GAGPAAVNPDESILLETFSTDTSEGMLASIQDGARVELIGRNIRMVQKKDASDSTETYDVYSVTAPVKTRIDRLSRAKFYFFDSRTGLLVRTQYEDGNS